MMTLGDALQLLEQAAVSGIVPAEHPVGHHIHASYAFREALRLVLAERDRRPLDVKQVELLEVVIRKIDELARRTVTARRCAACDGRGDITFRFPSNATIAREICRECGGKGMVVS